MDNILTVRELNFKLSQVLEARFPYLWIKGEVTNCVKASSGHIYFSLKDGQDLLNCVWFKRYHTDLSFDPLTGECFEDGCKPSLAHRLRDGQEIICAGKLAVYGARGQYQLVVEHALESGIGQLYEAFEKLKQKLSQEGLFDTKHKKSIPQNPRNVALITAPTGAVIHDFLRIAGSRGIKSRICIFPSLVQGDDAPAELRSALQKAEQYIFPDRKHADCIVLIRGGGSIQDLWAFNDEDLARAIFACGIPVITGIGHEPDFSIADYVSDKSCATPSHAAQFLWQDKNTLLQQLDDTEYTLKSFLTDYLKHKEKEYVFLSKNLEFVSPKSKLAEKSFRIQELSLQLGRAVRVFLQNRNYEAVHLAESIKQHRPQFSLFENSLLRLDSELGKTTRSALLQKESLLLSHEQKLQAGYRQKLELLSFELQKLQLKLEGNNPEKPLEKGYLYAERIRDGQKQSVHSVHDLQVQDILKLHVIDGTVQTKIEKISPKQKG